MLLAATIGLAMFLAAGAISPNRPSVPLRPVTSISRATFARVKPGMTVAEVMAILGPCGDRSTIDTEFAQGCFDSDCIVGSEDVTIARLLRWNTDSACVLVSINKAGKVGFATYLEERPSTDSSSTKIYKRIKRLWEAWFR
jgi:hypothetical protein